MRPLTLEQSILHTLAFFSLFDASLTQEEIYRFLWKNGDASEAAVKEQLRSLQTAGLIKWDRGYFRLTDSNVQSRVQKVCLVEKKMAIARRAATWLRYVPFLRAVFVCNNLALETVSEDSDVDVFIVVRPGRIWITRLMATMVLRMIGIARTRTKIVDRVCLSFYVTEDALDLSTITITDPDVYMMYWIRSLVPLYDPDNLYDIIQQKNSWIDAYIRPMSGVRLSSAWHVTHTWWSRRVQSIFETMWRSTYGDLIESRAKQVQFAKMKLRSSVRDEPDTRVIVSDTMLKFHENDRRLQYQEEWNARINRYTVCED